MSTSWWCSALLTSAVVGGCAGTPEGPSITTTGRKGRGQELIPDATGWIDRATTGKTEVQGAWYSMSDGLSLGETDFIPGDCQTRGGHADSECSVVLSKDPKELAFPPTDGLGMCLFGIAAKVAPGANGQPDYNSIWGLGIGTAFNLADWPQPRTVMNLPRAIDRYDALAHGVTGIAFDIDSEPAPRGGLKVQLPTVAAPLQSPWWGGATANNSPVHAGHNEFRWAEVGGPYYLSTPPPRFDPSQLLGISIVASSDSEGSKAVSFCINHLTLLTDP